MIRNKIRMRVLLLAVVLIAVPLIPVNAQNENDYSVTENVAFEHANAQIINFIANDPEFKGWKGAYIDPKSLELYDPNGQKLYYQFSVYKNDDLIGRIDVGANKTLGQSIQLIELTPPVLYNTTEALNKSINIAKNEYTDGEIISTEVVVYSYPSIGAMTVIKDKASGKENRIFVDAYTLEVVPDKPATETEPGIGSIFERRLQNGVEENLKSWQASDQLTNSIRQEVASKGICISVPVPLDDYLNSEISNVYYSHHHYFFGTNSYGNTVITRYGKLPALETEGQKENWNSILENLSNEIKNTVASKYMYPHGEIMTCGFNDQGYFVILFKYGNVNESIMDEIYTLIDNSAKEIGVQDIPVEFGYGIYREEIELDKEGIYHWVGESTENLSEPYLHIIEEHMKEKPEQLTDGSIATYGKIPLLKDTKEFEAWGYQLMLIVHGIRGKMAPYLEKDQVMGYGVGFTRIDVWIYENLSYEEKASLAEDIYQIIDEEARKQNVTDVPVVFDEGGEVRDDIAPESEDENTEELNNSGNTFESANGSKSSKISSTPGFEVLGSLACLYVGCKLRKK